MANNFREPQIRRADYWLRLILAIFYFGVLFYFVKILIGLAMAVQFILLAFYGTANERLLSFTFDLNRFSCHVLQFVTWNSDERPFPFADWPEPEEQRFVGPDA